MENKNKELNKMALVSLIAGIISIVQMAFELLHYLEAQGITILVLTIYLTASYAFVSGTYYISHGRMTYYGKAFAITGTILGVLCNVLVTVYIMPLVVDLLAKNVLGWL